MRQRYAFLLSPTWLGWLTVCVIFAVACFFLGQWQLDRREAALEEINRVVQNYDQDPAPYAQLREVFADPAAEDEWTVVSMRGEYLPEHQRLARNRGHAGQVGYEQVVPFREESTGDVLAVSRGWLPTASDDGSRPAFDPAPPDGAVEVVARLKPAEPQIDRGAPEGQIASIDVEALSAELELDMVAGSYALMAEESPQPAEAPYQLARPSLDEGPHLSYSLQWVAFGLLGFVGWGYAARVHARTRDVEQLDAPAAHTEAAASRLARQDRLRAAQRLRRQQAGKYSDEDAEDAWVEQNLGR
ncbi:SURF1 family protein [Nesterenkonia sp.]|uniref:SURF1 family cytochrome oxidase biogenesis protein n=1 Tax=Nesterenkonia sp. TaxID=704201 RepID=UPI00263481E2|nr:SURF1 family protein [Nesterenkonia sp.]